MYLLYQLLIIGQFLGFNPSLNDVALTRQTREVKYAISKEVNVKEYDCLIGVPYDYGYLIGQDTYFVESSGKIYGPFLVVDVESEHHQGIMDQRNLLADTNCDYLVHKKGILLGIKNTGR